MADEPIVDSPAAEVEESLSDFVARENALERGESPDPEPEPTPEPEGEPAPAAKVEPPKVDKRTKEGRKLTFQQEIDALAAQKHEAKRELEAAQAELAALRTQREQVQRPQPPQRPTPQAAPPEDREPTLNDFMKLPDGQPNPDPYSTWVRASAAWEARQEFRRQSEAVAAQQHQASIGQTWGGKLAEIRQRVPDIDQRLSQTPIDQRVWPFLQNHKQGPEIAEYLSQNISEAQALLSLHPIDQIGRIGEIVGKLSARSTAAPVAQRKPPVVSSAKPPIQPLGTSPVATAPEPGDDEPFSSFYVRENKAEGKRGVR